jgi:UDP-glucose 4-epimerase
MRLSKIVVTGGCGFIGSHIVDSLIAAEHKVVIIDNMSSRVMNYNVRAEMHELSLETNSLEEALEGVEVVVHAAAFANLRQNWDPETGATNRMKSFRDNVEATRALLEQLSPSVKKVIFLSTACVYGPTEGEHPTVYAPSDFEIDYVNSVYAANKIAAEALVSAYSKRPSQPYDYHILRLVNVVGPRTHQGVIADFVRMARQDRVIRAADNGSQKKNWVSVRDVASNVKYLCQDTRLVGGVSNLASEETISWWDVVEEMKKSGREFEVEHRDCVAGAVGDPVNIRVKSDFDCPTPIKEYEIRRALESLGWTR